MTARPRARRLGLVLGAGGTMGYAFHAGVLAALEDVGIDPRTTDAIVGTSAGAIAGAYVRAGLGGSDLAAGALGRALGDDARRLVARIRSVPAPPGAPGFSPADLARPASPGLAVRLATRPWRLLRPGLLGAALLPEGTQANTHVAAQVAAVLEGPWPAGLLVAAVRLDTGARVLFGDEDAPAATPAAAVAASAAIPAYFAPVEIGGTRYVDGALHSPTNADALAGRGLDVVVVSSPMSVDPTDARLSPDSLARLFFTTQLAAEVVRLRRDGAQVVVVQPAAAEQAVMTGSPMSARRSGDITRHAHAAALARLRAAGLAER